MKPKSTLRSCLLLAGSSLLGISYVHAASTWNAGTAVSTDALWSTPTNWSTDTAPLDGADLIFDGAANLTNTNDIPLPSIGSLTLNNAGWNITLGTVTLNSGIAATGTATLGGTLTLGAPQSWTNTTGLLTVTGTVANGSHLLTIGGANNTTISAILGSGAGGLIKDGAGTLTLSGENTYSGTTTLTSGTLQGSVVGTSLTPKPFGTSSLALNSGTLQLRASGTVNTTAETLTLGNTTTVGGTTTIDVNRPGATSTKKTIIMGTLGIGAHTLNITGGNSYVLRFGATTASGAAVFNPTTAPLSLASLTLDNSVTTGTTTTVTFGGTSTGTIVSGIISDNAIDSTKKLAIQKSGAGTLTLGGTSTYSGGTTLSAGTITAANNSALGTGTLTFDGNGTITPGYLSGGYTLANSVTVNPGVTATVNVQNQFYKLTFSSPVDGSGILTVTSSDNGKGNVILSSASNNFTGTLKVGSSTYGVTLVVNSMADSAVLNTNPIQIWRDTAGDTASAVPLTLGSGTASSLLFNNRQIELMGTTTGATINNANGTATNTITINTDLKVTGVGNKTLTLGGANTGANAFNGSIADATGSVISLTKADAGLWALGGANNHSGPTTLTGGTLSVAASNNLGAAASNLVFNGGTLRVTGTTLTSFSGIGHNVSFTATKVVGLDIADASHIFTADQVLNQTTGGLTKAGAGTLVLNQANTYTGTTTINAGVLQAIDGTSLPSGSGILQLRGGVFQSSGTFSRNVNATAGAGGVNWATSSGGFAARGGTLTLTLNGGTGSLTWANGTGNSFVFGTNILIFGSTSADSLVDFQNDINLGSSGTNTRTINVIDNPGSSTDIARISGDLTNTAAGQGLLKSGNGTLELTGNNSYTGNTTVSAGTLVLADNAQLKFVLGAASGTNNALTGAGTLTLNGDFVIDTLAADALAAGSWTLENVTTLTGGGYGSGFQVFQTDGITPWTAVGSDMWTKDIGGKLYTFDETTGILTLAATPGGSAYDTWADTNAPTTGNDPSADEDVDGVTNGVEFVLGGTISTNDLDKLPVIDTDGTDMTFTFERAQSSIDPNTSVTIEVSTDLATWNTPPSPYTVPDTATGVVNPGVTVVKGVPASFDTVTLTVSQAEAKKFARLKVVITP